MARGPLAKNIGITVPAGITIIAALANLLKNEMFNHRQIVHVSISGCLKIIMFSRQFVAKINRPLLLNFYNSLIVV